MATESVGSEKGRKKAESEQGGMGGRGSTRAGLGLNAPLRFGVLMENCGRAGPTAATVAAREAGTRPDCGERKRREGGRDEQPRGSRTLTHSHFCEGVSQTEEEEKLYVRN